MSALFVFAGGDALGFLEDFAKIAEIAQSNATWVMRLTDSLAHD